jgi:glycerol uptake facilitator protein
MTPLLVGLLVLAIGLSLGGHGLRDQPGARLGDRVSPTRFCRSQGRGTPTGGMHGVPVVGPIIGGVAGRFCSMFCALGETGT